jgi:trehalose 6-phosphate phosphatase
VESRLKAAETLPWIGSPSEFQLNSESLIALDFDGTLVEIAPRPDRILIPDSLIECLERVSRKHRLLICTGRTLQDLDRYVPASLPIDRIANHGLEWRTREGTLRHYLIPEWEMWKMGFLLELQPLLDVQGGILEDKDFTLTIHFRNSGKAWWGGVLGKAWLESKVDAAPVMLLPGTMTWNLIPEGYSKGSSLGRFAREQGVRRVLYFGDEATDETVFSQGNADWIGVKVGTGLTAADYRLAEPKDVRNWLSQLSMLESGLT